MLKKIARLILRQIKTLRYPYFYLRGNKIGRYSNISSNVALRKCKIGNYCHIGPNSSLNCVVIGNYCSFATDVMIGGEEHAYWDLSTSNHLSNQGVTEVQTIIGHDVWIGAQCYIKQGVKIGNGAVIGANSFVNKDIPDYAIVVGSPAKIVKYRFNSYIIDKLNQSRYWIYSPQKAKKILSQIN